MIFLDKSRALLSSTDTHRVETNAVLCGMCSEKPGHAEHIIYNPMSDIMIDHLVQSYKRKIPCELLTLYQSMNGADLFWTTRNITRLKISIPFCRFSIYGIPFPNSREGLAPFNISLEDLNRPKHTPEQWLKFGSFYEPSSFSDRRDLYVDTDSNGVYAVAHDCTDCFVICNWVSIDECLCDIFDLLSNRK